MQTIYKIEIQGYGVFVSHTNDFEETIKQTFNLLKLGVHFNLVLQYLYSKYPTTFSVNVLAKAELKFIYRTMLRIKQQFPFTIDFDGSPAQLNTVRLIQRYKLPVYALVFESGLTYIFKGGRQVGIEFAEPDFQPGLYDQVHHRKAKLNAFHKRRPPVVVR